MSECHGYLKINKKRELKNELPIITQNSDDFVLTYQWNEPTEVEIILYYKILSTFAHPNSLRSHQFTTFISKDRVFSPPTSML
jgi:hypothetical protein